MSLASDNLLVCGTFLLAIVPLLLALWLYMFGELDAHEMAVQGICFAAAGATIIIGSALYQWHDLWGLGCRSLPDSASRVLGAMVEDLTGQAGIRGRVLLRWSPHDLRVGARVYYCLGSPMILCTSGLIVTCTRRPEVAKAIIAHEIAHIRNRDFWIYPAIVALIAESCARAVGMWLTFRDHPGPVWIGLMMPFCIGIYVRWHLLSFIMRRRELLADAIAYSAMNDSEEYVKVLNTVAQGHPSAFRPSVSERRSAIEGPTGILATNAGIIGICIGMCALAIMDLVLVCGPAAVLALPAICPSLLLFYCAAIVEFRKGKHHKFLTPRSDSA